MVGNANDVFNKSGAMVLCELDIMVRGERGRRRTKFDQTYL
jgi:hypothetical protein